MNIRVASAFVSFLVLLAIWIGLIEFPNPGLNDLLIFVKMATGTAWTACALFFDAAAQPAIQPTVAEQPSIQPEKEPNHD